VQKQQKNSILSGKINWMAIVDYQSKKQLYNQI